MKRIFAPQLIDNLVRTKRQELRYMAELSRPRCSTCIWTRSEKDPRRMKIGILQTGRPPKACARRAITPKCSSAFWRPRLRLPPWHVVVGMEFPASVHDADGWLITGSRHGVYEDTLHPAARGVHPRRLCRGVPMVGICFGHQIMARRWAGRVEKFPGGWAVGPTEYDFEGQRWC
jgi:GMP synthase-like glutamine amidotransferase